MPTPTDYAYANRTASSMPAPELLIRSIFAIGLVFMPGAFTIRFVDGAAGQTFLQAVTFGAGAFGILMILSSREVASTVIRYRPLLGLIALAFASASWSIYSGITIKRIFTLLCLTAFGAALAGCLPQLARIRFIVRILVVVCVLSLVRVLAVPQEGIHGLRSFNGGPPVQFAHTGKWRGIFSHKQGLGLYYGLTTGLLLYYRTMIFSRLVWLLAIICSSICLWESQSATGSLTIIVTAGVLYYAHWISHRPPQQRAAMLVIFALVLLAICLMYSFGLFDLFIVHVLGRSTDLTGRTDYWALAQQSIVASDRGLLGAGFATSYGTLIIPNVSWDNGYAGQILEFGYGGSAIVFTLYGWIFMSGARLIIRTLGKDALVNNFPFSVMLVLLFVNISQSNFMMKHLSSVLIPVACYLIFQSRAALRSSLKINGTPICGPSGRRLSGTQ